jgi:methyl-accepting chemotaxis protein
LLDTIVPNIRRTSELVQAITAASAEQTSGVGQINAVVSQMSQSTQQNAASSEELAATALEMSSQAEQLQSTIAFFKLAPRNSGTASRKTSNPAFLKGKNLTGVAARSSDASLARDIAQAAAPVDVPDDAQVHL